METDALRHSRAVGYHWTSHKAFSPVFPWLCPLKSTTIYLKGMKQETGAVSLAYLSYRYMSKSVHYNSATGCQKYWGFLLVGSFSSDEILTSGSGGIYENHLLVFTAAALQMSKAFKTFERERSLSLLFWRVPSSFVLFFSLKKPKTKKKKQKQTNK